MMSKGILLDILILSILVSGCVISKDIEDDSKPQINDFSCGDSKLQNSILGQDFNGFSEECELPDLPCPTGLDCVDCRCRGCGDGRLDEGEQCDPYNRRSRYDMKLLWEGKFIDCADPGLDCTEDCRCVKAQD